MNTRTVESKRASFTQDWMTWLVLRHFLPARDLRQLAHTLVKEASRGKIEVEQLFEELDPDAPLWNECWLLRPREVQGKAESFFQRLVRSLAWQNDEGGWPDPNEDETYEGVDQHLVEKINQISHADFGLPLAALDEFEKYASALQGSFRHYLDAFRMALGEGKTADVSTFWESVMQRLGLTTMPLQCLLVKHIADLCADSDLWDKALGGYERTEALLEGWECGAEWGASAAAWKAITLQSKAAALDVIESPAAAANILKGMLAGQTLGTDPLLVANAALDAVNASSDPRVDGWRYHDGRVALVLPTLLNETHDSSSGIDYWLRGKHLDAMRRFWATLRRQTALGAATESRRTKAWYARSLLDQVSETSNKDVRPDTFRMAVRLLVESTRRDIADKIVWSAAVVDAYVDEECVRLVQSIAKSFEGKRIEREIVVVGLFEAWTTLISPTRQGLRVAMWRHVATLAHDFPVTFEASTDLGRQSLKALRKFAGDCHGLRREVAKDVARAIHQKLRSDELFWAKSEALETANSYADTFNEPSLVGIVEATLDVLSAEEPARGNWNISRPAIRFLVSDPAKRLADTKDQLARRIIEQLLRFGLHKEGDHAELLFHLTNFQPSLLHDPSVRGKLEEPLRRVREKALQINSSAVTANICALLVAPEVSGKDGIKDALAGLALTLRSARGNKQSIGLGRAYDGIILLVQKKSELEKVLGEDRDWWNSALDELLGLVVDFWGYATERPLLLTSFGFPPPTKPDRVVVHNWAFASMRLADELGKSEVIEAALIRARALPDLEGAISLARSMGRPAESIDLSEVRANDREAFYLSLGRRLARLQQMSGESAADLCRALVEQCMRFGPRPLDAAVLMAAARMNLHQHVRNHGLEDYASRVDNDRDQRLALGPLLDVFDEKSAGGTHAA